MSYDGPNTAPIKHQGKDKVKKNERATLRTALSGFLVSLRHQFESLVSDENFEGNVDSQEDVEVEQELEQLVNMTKIPFRLERFMLWTLLACFDCFLDIIITIPVKIISDLVFKNFKRNRKPLANAFNKGFMVFMIVIASCILSKLDTSKAYHRIKRQSSVKLYMLFGVLEMADKMLATMGQSLFTIILAKKFHRSKLRQLLLSCITVIYLACHGYVMVYQTVALHVAVNSYSNAFLTLLLSMQFAEIKAALLKKIDKEGLFQLAIADVVERSQLIFLLIIIALRNVVAKSRSQSNMIPNSWNLHATSSVIIGVICGPMFNVVGSELIVDWIKHAYVTKFNRIRPRIYDKFLLILCRDYTTSLHRFCDRLGLPVPALVVLFIVMIRPTLAEIMDSSSALALTTTILTILTGFCFLILIKLLLHMVLMSWASSILADKRTTTAVTESEYVPGMLSGAIGRIDQGARNTIYARTPRSKKVEESPSIRGASAAPPTLNDIRKMRDSKNPHSLENVARYKMVSKRIW